MMTVYSVGRADTCVVLWCQVKVLETLQRNGNRDITNEKTSHFIAPLLPEMQNLSESQGRAYLVGVFGVNPGHLEHVFDLFSEANACSTISCDVNAWDSLSSSQL